MTEPTPEQYRALADDGDDVPGGVYASDWIRKATFALRAAASELERLRTTTENAPHDVDACERVTYDGYDAERPCTCWKASLS